MKVLVYPYDEEFEVFIKHKDFLKNIEILELLSPSGWGLQNKVIEKSFIVKTDIKEVDLENVDALLLVDSIRNDIYKDEMMSVASQLAKSHKNIVLNRCISDKEYFELQNLCRDENVQLVDIRNQSEEMITDDTRLKSIETPVVIIAGMGEHCNKLEVQMSLIDYLDKIGYKVSSVTSRSNMEIAGMHSFPKFMYGNTLDESSKIVNFNHYIKRLETEEKPNIILIGIPGSIMPISKKHSEHFGVFAFEVFNSIKCDIMVLCMHNNAYTKEYFEEVKKLCKYKFQTDIDAFAISNYAYDSFSLESEGNIKYLYFDDEQVHKCIENYPNNVYERLSYKKLGSDLISILADYADYQIM